MQFITKVLLLCIVVIATVPCVSAETTDVTQAPISWDILRAHLMYAYAAYCPQQYLQNWSCYWCRNVSSVPSVTVTQLFETDQGVGTYGYVGHEPSSIVVSFRGSASLENWLKNAEFWQTTYPGVPGAAVHYGFYTGYMAVSTVVVNAVKAVRSKYPSLPVKVTGHSLGAAFATLCALDLLQHGVNNVQHWTFGQPRVGNQAFANYFNSQVTTRYRTVNQNDLVPHVPPSSLLGYYHVATEVWFPSNYQSYVICPGSGEDPNCSDSDKIYSIEMHLMYLGYDQKNPQC